MAVLSNSERADAAAEMQRDESRERQTIAGLKSEVRDLINAMDDYLDTNAIAMNQAIPQPARGNFTARQKARALIYVVNKRFLQN